MIAGSTLLLAAVLAGCSDQSTTTPLSRSPAARSSVLVTTTTVWDFAAIQIPGVPGPVDDGASHLFAQTGLGSILASSPDRRVTVKGGDLAVDASERGLGLCLHSGSQANGCVFPTDGDEVGDPGSPSSNSGVGTLLLNFNSVLPANSVVKEVSLGSMQANEGYRMSISQNGGSTFGAASEVFPNAGEVVTVSINLPITNLVIKFEKTTTNPSAVDDDYTVRSVTTTSTVDVSPQWCSPGYWWHHPQSWPTGYLTKGYNDFTNLYAHAPTSEPGDPTLFDVISHPSTYKGPAINNVADILSNVVFGTTIGIEQDNCPLN
jgi:hypothetical protein